MNLRQLGEDRLLHELLPSLGRSGGVILPAGDDCAVVPSPRGKLLLLKTDCVVENVHFRKDTPPKAVGWKAMMRPLSDFAAMSGVPQFALVTLMIPGRTTREWVRKLYDGLRRAASRFDVTIVGGETSSTKDLLAISISVSGFVERTRWVSRRGGRRGDDLFVTGRLGGSLRRKHLSFVPRIDESRWLTKNFVVHAMMDLSDGLGADLPRLAAASGVGFELEYEKIPRTAGAGIKQAITDGEDYELLFATPKRERPRLLARWRARFPKVPLTQIGRLTVKSATNRQKLPGGYVHFK
jgi:thiamine-monophosphate kinase